MASVITITSLNLKGLNRGSPMLIEFKSSDLVCVQETWLRPSELYKLSNFDNLFDCFTISGMDGGDVVNNEISFGRQFGGVGIFYRKSSFDKIINLGTDYKIYIL